MCNYLNFSCSNADCSNLPKSMNPGKGSNGCPGAVWSTGNPSKNFCKGQDSEGKDGKYPWWSKCCYWDGNSCKPNSSLGNLFDIYLD